MELYLGCGNIGIQPSTVVQRDFRAECVDQAALGGLGRRVGGVTGYAAEGEDGGGRYEVAREFGGRI